MYARAHVPVVVDACMRRRERVPLGNDDLVGEGSGSVAESCRTHMTAKNIQCTSRSGIVEASCSVRVRGCVCVHNPCATAPGTYRPHRPLGQAPLPVQTPGVGQRRPGVVEARHRRRHRVPDRHTGAAGHRCGRARRSGPLQQEAGNRCGQARLHCCCSGLQGLNRSGVDPPLSSSRACLTTFIANSVP